MPLPIVECELGAGRSAGRHCGCKKWAVTGHCPGASDCYREYRWCCPLAFQAAPVHAWRRALWCYGTSLCVSQPQHGLERGYAAALGRLQTPSLPLQANAAYSARPRENSRTAFALKYRAYRALASEFDSKRDLSATYALSTTAWETKASKDEELIEPGSSRA